MDLLIPSLGPNARKTNYDYTKGQLDDLLTVIIEEKAKLFVCAVGVPPKEAVKRLHDNGIVCMNVSRYLAVDVYKVSELTHFLLRWSATRNMCRKL